jgi:hypothetical protein
MGLVLSGFEGGLSITQGILGGDCPKNRDFCGPLNGASVVSAIWAQKSPMDSPLSNPLRTAPYKQQVH